MYCFHDATTTNIKFLTQEHLSCARVNLMDTAAWCLSGYIEIARERGLITKKVYKRMYQLLRLDSGIDGSRISVQTMIKWGYRFNLFERLKL